MKKRFMWFFGPENDGGGGDGGDAPSVTELLGEPNLDGEEPEIDGEDGDGGAGDKAKSVKASTTANVDLDALTTKFGDVIGQHFSKVQAHPEPKPEPALTPEQARKALQLMEIDDNYMTRFGDLKTQKQALEEFRDGVLRTAYIMVESQRKQMEQLMEGRFSPIQSMLENQQRQALVARFDETYPQLSDPELRPLLDTVASQLGAAKKLTNDPVENFKLIAEGAARVIAKTAPDFKLEPQGSATKKPAQSRPGGIPVTSRGGGGGGGSSRQQADPGTSKLVQLLGKVGV